MWQAFSKEEPPPSALLGTTGENAALSIYNLTQSGSGVVILGGILVFLPQLRYKT